MANPNALDALNEISREMPDDCPVLRKVHGSLMDGFMMTAYGCAVFESELADGRFDYIALNLTNGAKLRLDRRKNPITNKTVEGLVRKLRDSKVAGLGRLEISGDEPIPLSKLKFVLNELFREILPSYGYAIRDGQIALANELLDAMARRRVLLGEASVGIGKTLVYIIVGALIRRSHVNRSWNGSYFDMSAAEWGRMPIAISTSSIALQKAVITEYIPAISKILLESGVIDSPLRACLRKGKEHYVCEYNLRAHIPFENDKEIKAALVALLKGGRIDLAEVTTGPSHAELSAHVKSKICVPAKCVHNCPYVFDCRYRAFREAANVTPFDFIVCNHNLLLADVKIRAEGKSHILPPYQMLVIDEAHKLLNAARSIYGSEFSVDVVISIAKTASMLNYAPNPLHMPRKLKEFRGAVNILAKNMMALTGRLFDTDASGDVDDKLLLGLRSTAEYFLKTLQDSETLAINWNERLKQTLVWELGRFIETVTPLCDGGEYIRWFEKDTSAGDNENAVNVTLCGIPKRLNEIINRDLWQRGVPTALVSGTLSVGGDFAALKQSVGLSRVIPHRIAETTQTSPFDYRKNALLYISKSVPFPGFRGCDQDEHANRRYIAALTDEIERLIIAANGHTAVLFTSYKVMGQVYVNLEKRGLGFPMFMMARGTSNAIEQFKESGNGVLFACGAMWEGIDIPGDALSMLIIVKLPFAVPDKIGEYEQTLYSSFAEYKRRVITPEMLLKMKQAHGRGLRTEKDTCVIAILDCRAQPGGAYYGVVFDALPTSEITNSITVANGFLRRVKPPGYWRRPVRA